jgi:multidrug efflux pump subunit AcrA (membrane-fusion protein)
MNNASDANLVKKRTIARIAAIFTGVMLLLTFFSNTINNFSLPRVQLESPISGALIKEVTGEGSVEAAKELKIYASQGRRVEEVKAKAGDKVSKGQVIILLDKEDLEEQLKVETIKYEKLKLTLEGLNAANAEKYSRPVEAAGEAVQEAQKNLDRVRTLYDAGAATGDELGKAEDMVKGAQKNYTVQKEEETAGLSEWKRLIKSTGYDVELQKMAVDKLQRELSTGSVLEAPMDGVVTELNYQEGSLVNNTIPVYAIADLSKSFRFRATVEEKSSEYLEIGDEIQVRLGSASAKILSGKVSEITANMESPGERKDILVALPAEGLSGGEHGEIYVGKRTRAYAVLVPNSAVGTDNNGHFVWVVKEKKGPLSNEFYVQKAAIKAEDSDNFKTVVLQGLELEDKVIVKYSKSISEGSRVIIDR